MLLNTKYRADPNSPTIKIFFQLQTFRSLCMLLEERLLLVFLPMQTERVQNFTTLLFQSHTEWLTTIFEYFQSSPDIS